MARFADILKGKRARRTVPFPQAPSLPGGAPPEAQEDLVVDLVVLSAEEEAKALGEAIRFAKKNGDDDPKPNTPLYDLGLMIATLLVSCLDSESPEEKPVPFFANSDEIMANLDRERIAYLYALQQVWQDELSPARKRMSEDEMLTFVLEAAGTEDPLSFFEKLPPGTLARCLVFSGRLLLTLRQHRLPASSSSTPTGTSGSSDTESESAN